MKTYSLNSKKYFKIDEAAYYFSIDASFLKKRMGKDFIEGVHYFKAVNAKITRWDIKALEECIFGLLNKKEEEDELLSLLAS